MITERYEAKQPPAMLRRGNFMTSCFYGGFVSVCVCVRAERKQRDCGVRVWAGGLQNLIERRASASRYLMVCATVIITH